MLNCTLTSLSRFKTFFKTFFLLLLVFSIFIPLATGEITEVLSELDYQESDLEILFGNVSLSFNTSTRDGNNDLKITKLFYEATFNFTIFKVESKEIEVDHTFVNDTKSYYYNNSNDMSETYVVHVNYSSLHVPTSPWEYYVLLLEKKNQTIDRLESALANMTSNSTTNGSKADNLSKVIVTIQTELTTLREERNELMEYKISTSPIVEDYDNLSNLYDNQTGENKNLLKDNEHLEDGWDDANKTIDSFGPFTITYSRGGIDNNFYISISWLLIGAVGSLGIYLLYSSKIMTKPKTILTKLHKTVKRKGVAKPVDWNEKDEDYPDVEKEFLKPPDVDKKVDDAITNGKIDKKIKDNEKKNDVPSEEKKLEEEKKPDWWTTPEGADKVEELNKLAKKQNTEKIDDN